MFQRNELQFERDFRQILKASLKLYNGTDTVRSVSDDTVLMKAAWDKIMIEVTLLVMQTRKLSLNRNDCF